MKLNATIVLFILGSASLHAADAPSALAPVLQSFVDQHIAPGVVALVADKDGVRALDKAGYVSRANKTPIREDAAFWIASMSKSLTGTALMMLVDEGQVSLDDPVENSPLRTISADFAACCCAGGNSTANATFPKTPYA